MIDGYLQELIDRKREKTAGKTWTKRGEKMVRRWSLDPRSRGTEAIIG